MSRLIPLVEGYHHGLQSLQVRLHHLGILDELLIGHSVTLKQREHDLATISIGDDSHRVEDRLPFGKRNDVIQNAKFVLRDKADTDKASRRLH